MPEKYGMSGCWRRGWSSLQLARTICVGVWITSVLVVVGEGKERKLGWALVK